MRKYCAACKYFDERGPVVFCDHPSARIPDRVYGQLRPVIDANLTTKCDEHGWYEEKEAKRHWWRWWP